MSNYACPVHYEPVTWRGTGCTECAHDRHNTPQQRVNGKRAFADYMNARQRQDPVVDNNSVDGDTHG